MKKIIAPVVLAAALALTGCGGEEAPAAGGVENKVAETPQIPDLDGDWKQSNATNKESYQQATIAGDTITIEWVSDGGDTTSIYWVGSYEAPTDGNEPHTWASQRDTEATDFALLASTDETKEFTYEEKTISYKVSLMGTTTTVELEK